MRRLVPEFHRYKKHPEFNGLEKYVWEYLSQADKTIPQIERSKSKQIQEDPTQRDNRNKPIWGNKQDLDNFVARSLRLEMDDYGKDKSYNPLYKATANEISNLRKAKILVDSQKIDQRRTGVWRLDSAKLNSTKLEEYVYDHVGTEVKEGDYHSSGSTVTIFVRQKQRAFRDVLLKEYRKCVLCGFRLTEYMIGAHIVPYATMRKEDPHNSMNPANGLLLCRLCDVAFEDGSIIVEEDLGITISSCLQGQYEPPMKSWIQSIPPEIRLKGNPEYPPDIKYLRWKKSLVTAA